ncbi:ATP synthase F1 subunit epsilon [Stenotrophomonas rhizophila]|uniref:ATP synthase F1 subunit epsilon n=1 Tax=Stenotrophomonas rhizophila TaxID=216778 RepID=UPI001E56DA0D|nr:ATP synthase F1 subunit epsilon [Stenotrophomonas rhizophila]MCC7633945.1 ATP synthase F1 subunit epsilon [Stenotrophomonas rhizophila]MCC7663279.1 ATP synthase F1 subunit epsilon [Stenotrophomonas rhizophila]
MASPPSPDVLPGIIPDAAQGLSAQIISLVGEIWNGPVREISLPGSEGRFGVLAGHTPLLALLREGMVSVFPLDAAPPLHVYVPGGHVEVQPGKVIVLADLALRSDDLDAARARAARDAAGSPLAIALTDPDNAKVHAELALLLRQQLRALPFR